jgi:hypothetical protein
MSLTAFATTCLSNNVETSFDARLRFSDFNFHNVTVNTANNDNYFENLFGINLKGEVNANMAY